ncbi:unnamed protein product [Porites evermanni]|uniref:TLC domain-containing protein n=1 Tax=Porites evermanni TaxID=104178 RepID=A0ABN8QWP0_9CNID|nr:unnamed protein product [Porites evermanni]
MALGYFEAFVKTWRNHWVEWKKRGLTKTFLKDFIDDVSTDFYISANDILLCAVLGIFFTVTRFFLNEAVFKPIFRKFKLLAKEEEKCPESAFKLLFYSIAYGYCFHLLFSGKYDFFHETKNCWRGWYKGMPVPQDIYTLYVVQAGYYIHALYAVLFMDLWRKDSILTFSHHILTISLIVLSFSLRYHKIGVLVLFLHDVNDVFLEFGKLCVAFKTRNGKYHLLPDILGSVTFLCFTLLWVYCRLYLYPIKVLFAGSYEFSKLVPNRPFYFSGNIMLWILFGMNLWWFQYILRMLIRAVTGKKLEDIREDSEIKDADGKID